MFPFLNHESFGPLLPNDLGVLPELVLLPFGDPSLDQNVFRVLRRRNMLVLAHEQEARDVKGVA